MVVGVALVLLPPVPEITQHSAPSATTSPTTARIRAVGNPARLATIPCASRRRANQSSRPSSPRGGSKRPPPVASRAPPVVSNSPSCRRTLHGAYDPAVALRDDRYVGGRGRRPGGRGGRRRARGHPRDARRRRRPSRGVALRARVAHEADRRAGRARRGRGGGDRPRRAGRRAPGRVRAPAPRPRSRRGTCSRTRPGCPRSGPAGVPALDVEPVRPPATRRVYSNEGYAVLGALLAAATGIGHAEYVRQAVFEPLGMDAYLGLPEPEDAPRARRARAGAVAAGPAALQLARVARAGDGRGRRVRDRATPTPASCRCSCRAGAPLIARRDVRRAGARCSSRASPAGSSRSRPGTSPTGGSAATSATAKEPHWTGTRTLARDAVALRRRRHADVGRPGRAASGSCASPTGARTPGWMMQPGGWPDLSDRRLAEAA